MRDCYRPTSMSALARDLGWLTPQSVIIAGGTDAVIALGRRDEQPDTLLSLDGISALRRIDFGRDELRIGSMATMHQIAETLGGAADVQALADAAATVGSPQIRNKATIGGNVANASPAADTPVALCLLGAEAEVMGPGGVIRRAPVGELFAEDGGNSLGVGEIICAFVIRREPLEGWRTAFVKLGSRQRVTISRIGLAIGVRLGESHLIEDIRVFAGAIKSVPFELVAAEEGLRGRVLSHEAIDSGELPGIVAASFIGNTRRRYKELAAKGVAADVLARLVL